MYVNCRYANSHGNTFCSAGMFDRPLKLWILVYFDADCCQHYAAGGIRRNAICKQINESDGDGICARSVSLVGSTGA